jgi:hypothetical protein
VTVAARRLLLVALLGSLAPSLAGAEEFPPAAPKRHHIPLLLAQYFFFGSTTLADGADELTLRGQTLSLTGMGGGRLASIDSILSGSLQYDLTHVTHWQGSSPVEVNVLHSVFARLAFLHSFSPRWGMMLFVRAGVSSDFGGLSWSDTRAASGAAATFVINDRVKIDFGFTYTNNFINDLVLPLVNLQYRRERLRVEVLVPRGAEVSYAVRPAIELGVKAFALSYRYRLHNASRLGLELAQVNVHAGPFARFYLHRGLFVMLEGGYNVQYSRVRRDLDRTLSLLSWAGGYLSFAAGYMY